MLSDAWQVVRAFASFLYPHACAGCDLPLEQDGTAGHANLLLCPHCLAALRRVSPTDGEYLATRRSILAGGAIDGLAAAWYFDSGGPLQVLIHALKYAELTSAGRLLGRTVGRWIHEWCPDDAEGLLVPVPLHRAKLRERGYNQAAWIARGIAEELDFAMVHRGVRRRLYTQSQTHLGREERKKNVEGAFAITRWAAERLRGTTVLLVDDVITTGSTMQACAVALKAAGVRRVVACAVALAPAPDRS